MPHVAHLWRYPIKSLDPEACESVAVLPSGALADDRRWALVDATGRFINGKQYASIHQLRFRRLLPHLASGGPHEKPPELKFVFSSPSLPESTFSWPSEQAAAAAWLSTFFGQPVQIEENTAAGFPDDHESPGPTVVSTATLETVASWFPGLTLDQVRRRFRANIELAGVEPFWEDRLFGPAGSAVPFTLGNVPFEGMNPCQRCAVPSRDPDTGAVIAGFAKKFSVQREATLPSWTHREQFNHFYRLTVNTRPPAGFTGGTLRVGDTLALES